MLMVYLGYTVGCAIMTYLLMVYLGYTVGCAIVSVDGIPGVYRRMRNHDVSVDGDC